MSEEDVSRKLWWIYSQLKDAEDDAEKRLQLLERPREELEHVINQLNRQSLPDIYRALGAKGGSARTEAKAAAARTNGAQGGRPSKTYFCSECVPLGEEESQFVNVSQSQYGRSRKCTTWSKVC